MLLDDVDAEADVVEDDDEVAAGLEDEVALVEDDTALLPPHPATSAAIMPAAHNLAASSGLFTL